LSINTSFFRAVLKGVGHELEAHRQQERAVSEEQPMSSDIAALRQRIETECAAIHQAMYGVAVVSKHEIIANRFAALHRHTGQLAHVVGEQEANRFTCQTYAQVMGQP